MKYQQIKIDTEHKTIDQDVYPYPKHLWRTSPFGMHSVKEYAKHNHNTENAKDIIVHQHDAKNPSGKDELKFVEIQVMTNKYFYNLKGLPNSDTKLNTNPNFITKDGTLVDVDKFDFLIRGWTQYWTPLMKHFLKFEDNIDGNWIKALIATESTFKPDEHNGMAVGLMQLTKQTRDIFLDIHGELKHYFVILHANEWLDPSANICAGIRWLCHKRHLLKAQINRMPTWKESCIAYKSMWHDYSTGKLTDKQKLILKNLQDYYDLLQQSKCNQSS
jgi:hypothetical protein